MPKTITLHFFFVDIFPNNTYFPQDPTRSCCYTRGGNNFPGRFLVTWWPKFVSPVSCGGGDLRVLPENCPPVFQFLLALIPPLQKKTWVPLLLKTPDHGSPKKILAADGSSTPGGAMPAYAGNTPKGNSNLNQPFS